MGAKNKNSTGFVGRFANTLVSLLMVGIFTFANLPAAWAAVSIPQNLTASNRQEITRIVGFGTANKLLSDPYPLGGFAGFEVGMSVNDLTVTDLAAMGNKLAAAQSDLAYATFTVGKGFYQNLDLFLNFSPYAQGTNLSQFGGLVRWGFYQGKFLPVSVSWTLGAGSSNLNNQVTTQNVTSDVIAGIDVETVSLFAGAGVINATGGFMGGNSKVGSITDTGNLEYETVSGTHALVGANIRFHTAFVALQMDRYTIPTYSAKLGLRY